MKKSNIIIELILTFVVGYLCYKYLGYIIDLDYQQTDNVLLNNLVDLIPFYIGAACTSGWYLMSSLGGKRKKKQTSFSFFSYPMLKFIASGFIGVYILPFRTIRNIFKLIA